MATEATFTVGAKEFALGTIFESVPGVTVELERIVPGDGVIIPYFWVRGVNIDGIEAMFSDHPGVKAIRLMDEVEDEYLLRVEWNQDYVGILSTLAEAQVPLISAVGTNTEWTFKLRGDSRSDLADFQRLCAERDISVELTALHALTPVDTTTESALTDPQYEVLVLAHERGYFNSPRDVTMEELGDELGISQQAVSSRLQRGMHRLLEQTLSALEAQTHT